MRPSRQRSDGRQDRWPTIGIASDYTGIEGSEFCRGVADYEPWRHRVRLRYALRSRREEVTRLLHLRPDAVLFHGMRSMLAAWSEWPAETAVVTACKALPGTDEDVVIDMDSLIRLAVMELARAGYPRVAFAGMDERQARCCARHADAAGVEYVSFTLDPSWDRPPGVSLLDTIWDQQGRWLLSLPRPVGVVSTQSSESFRLLRTCSEDGVAVPDEVGLMTVASAPAAMANDVRITSIDSPFRRLGYQAARVLDARLHGAGRQPQVVLQPIGVQRRSSTQPIFAIEANVSRAVRLIRAHIADGINVTELAQRLSMPRNRLTRLFLAHTGCKPSEVIRRVRMAAASEMLQDTDLPISEVARRSGFTTPKSFSRSFGAAFKASPTAYRAQRRIEP